MSDTPKTRRKKSKKPPENSPPADSIQGILLLLEESNLSPAAKWYVERLSEVYNEIVEGKSPKVKLEILQELRDFIIPAEDLTPQQEIHDPAVDGPLKMTGTE